jgi:hypothetical protein
MAARERLSRLKQECPSSSCIPHFEWLLGQASPPAEKLTTAPRALDLCLARCDGAGDEG